MLTETSCFSEETVLKTIRSMFASFPNTIDFREETWTIDVQEFPFFFNITKCPSLGWSVFLQPKSNDLSANDTIDIIYHQIDLYLGSINFSNFDFAKEDQEKVCARITTLEHTLKTLSTSSVAHHISRKSPGILQISYEVDQSDSKPCMEIGYSQIFKRWDFDSIKGEQESPTVHQLRKEILNKVATYLITWNLPFLNRA